MKKVLALFIFLSGFTGYGQKKTYTSTGIEFIFSFANIDSSGQKFSNTVRFTGFLNLQQWIHLDISNNIGLFSGIAIRNVGFIFDHQNTSTKMRSYALGFPVGIKIGDFKENFYFYGGGELEWMFHFKRKEFINDRKIVFSEWFSNRTNPLAPSVFAGIQFPKGWNIKFKYYLTDFLNKDFTETINGVTIKPYKDWRSQMFYFSIGLVMHNKGNRRTKRKQEQKTTEAYYYSENSYSTSDKF